MDRSLLHVLERAHTADFSLYDSKNKPPALQGEGSSLDQRNSCAKINVGLQTTNKKHRRSKEWTQIV